MIAETHTRFGATLAPDGIPLHYGDVRAEYEAALHAAVLMDRSHEGRFSLAGRDRLALPQRMSSNDLISLPENHGTSTIFTNPNARIIDRAVIYHRPEDALVLTEAGRGQALRAYLQRNIFFNDDVRIENLETSTRRFSLHGPQADAVIAAIAPDVVAEDALICRTIDLAGVSVTLVRSKAVSGSHWGFVVPETSAGSVFAALLETGRSVGLRAAGSLAYNALRIRAGRPAPGRELSADYIPLEVGLWDEISFSKGCYTGQEIIARMESRRKLARTMVTVSLSQPLDAPQPLTEQGKPAGMLTSAVETPLGEHLGIAVIRVAFARVGTNLQTESGTVVTVTGLAGAQPVDLLPEDVVA